MVLLQQVVCILEKLMELVVPLWQHLLALFDNGEKSKSHLAQLDLEFVKSIPSLPQVRKV